MYASMPRINLSFSVDGAGIGKAQQVFGTDSIANIEPGGIEAYRLQVDCWYGIALIDLEVEYVTPGLAEPATYNPEEIILVHAPRRSSSWDGMGPGNIVALSRRDALTALTGQLWKSVAPPRRTDDFISLRDFPEESVSPHVPFSCTGLHELLVAGSGRLSLDSPQTAFNAVRASAPSRSLWGMAILSFATGGINSQMPTFALRDAQDWLADNANLGYRYDGEEQLSEQLLQSVLNAAFTNTSDRVRYLLEHLDKTLSVTSRYDALAEHRSFALTALVGYCGQRSVDYLMQVIAVDPGSYYTCFKLVFRLMKSDPAAGILPSMDDGTTNHVDSRSRIKLLRNWWLHQNEKYSNMLLDWERHSPRLVKAIGAYTASEEEAMMALARDADDLVRYSLAINPDLSPQAAAMLEKDKNYEIKHVAQSRLEPPR
jgi:hypothetical protein